MRFVLATMVITLALSITSCALSDRIAMYAATGAFGLSFALLIHTRRSEARWQILLELQNGPKLGSELRKTSGLKQLESAGFIAGVDAGKYGRLYTLTELGKALLEEGDG